MNRRTFSIGLVSLGLPRRRSEGVEAPARHRGPITSLSVAEGTVYSASQAGVFADQRRLRQPDWRVMAVAARGGRLWLGGGVPGESGQIGLYAPDTGAPIAVRQVSDDLVYDLAVSADGNELTWGDSRGRIRTLPAADFSRGRIVERLAHAGSARVVRYAPRGDRVASGGLDGAVILHEPEPGRKEASRRLQEHTAGVESLAFSPDGQWVASGSRDSRVRLHRVADGRLWRTYTGIGMESEPVVARLPARVLALAWVRMREERSTLLAGTSNGGLYELSEEASRWKKLGQVESGPITSLAWKVDQVVMGSQAADPLLRPLPGAVPFASRPGQSP